jgi:hypothetical protein
VGYALGTGGAGTNAELTGSLVPGSFINGGPDSLVAGSNDGFQGQYEFAVINGTLTSAAPEPASTLLFGSGVICLALFVRRSVSRGPFA